MKVELVPIGYFRKYIKPGEKKISFILEEPLTIRELIKMKTSIKLEKTNAFVLVNGSRADLSYKLKDGDIIKLIFIVGGG